MASLARTLALVALALVALVAAAALALWLLLPGWMESEASRELAQARVEAILGEPLVWDDWSLARKPLRLELQGLRLGKAGDDERARLRAGRAVWPLDLSLLSGASGSRELAPVLLEDVVLRLAPRLSLALSTLEVQVTLPEAGTAEPLALQGEGPLAHGGRLRAQGTWSASVPFSLRLDLEELDLDTFTGSFGSVRRLAGQASGPFEIGGRDGHLTTMRARFEVPDARVRIDDLAMEGPLVAELDFIEERFVLEADGADIKTRGRVRYHKPAGTPARVAGRVTRRPDGRFDLVEAKLRIGGS